MGPVHLLSLILIAVIGTSCSKTDSDPDVAITGEWKLEAYHFGFVDSLPTDQNPVNYRDSNIIYHFQPNGTLVISSDIEIQPWLYSEGSYSYKFELLGKSDDNEYSHRAVLKIEEKEWPCLISRDKMNFGNPPLDEPLFRFMKL